MKHFSDPMLGAFIYDTGEHAWIADVSANANASFQLKLGGGDSKPAPELLAAAKELLAVPKRFCDDVLAFLERTILEDPDFCDYAGEIRALQVEDLSLFSADRPNSGMIYFSNGLRGRVWRCDFVDGRPKSLGFDS